MGQSVQEFIKALQAKEREEYEKKRDAHLIKLGLVNENESINHYSKTKTAAHTRWDAEKKMWYYSTYAPLAVSDDEYEEIKRLTKNTQGKTESFDLYTPYEDFLNIVLTILLVAGILGGIIMIAEGGGSYSGDFYIYSGAVTIFTSLTIFAIGRVLLSISINLHKLNYKVKKME